MFKKLSNSKGATAGKGLFDKTWSWLDKNVGEPMNKYAGKMGIEGVWPTSMDREIDKAARILRVFTLDGGPEVEETLNVQDEDAQKKTQKVLKRIPAKALREAEGIAIFTVFRTGLGLSGASGSGLVIARKPDGSWGGPSGLLVHTIGFGFLIGIDVYDVVLILRTKQAVKSFTHAKLSLGAELAMVAGPVGTAASADTAYQQAPAWSYVKSKGFYAGVQLDGSIIIERQDENANFYGISVSAAQILEGRTHIPTDVEALHQTILAASDRDTKTDHIPGGMAPSEATGGVLDHSARHAPLQPVEGFGAPPVYDDLEIIKVKCSDCGASMSMEELELHDCSGTAVRVADPAEKRRAVPLPPPPPRREDKVVETTSDQTSITGVPPETEAQTGKSQNRDEASESAAVTAFGSAIEDVDPALATKHEDETKAITETMDEIRLDDDLGEGKIEMTIEDDTLHHDEKATELAPVHHSNDSETSFKSAHEISQ